jgi:aldose 1-epimerase
MAGAALLPVALLVCLALASGADAARKPVGFYELKNKKGDFSIKVTNWGATLVSVFVPDCKGMAMAAFFLLSADQDPLSCSSRAEMFL